MKVFLNCKAPVRQKIADIKPTQFCRVTYANWCASNWQEGDVVFVADTAAYNITRNEKCNRDYPWVDVAPLAAGDSVTVTI